MEEYLVRLRKRQRAKFRPLFELVPCPLKRKEGKKFAKLEECLLCEYFVRETNNRKGILCRYELIAKMTKPPKPEKRRRQFEEWEKKRKEIVL